MSAVPDICAMDCISLAFILPLRSPRPKLLLLASTHFLSVERGLSCAGSWELRASGTLGKVDGRWVEYYRNMGPGHMGLSLEEAHRGFVWVGFFCRALCLRLFCLYSG